MQANVLKGKAKIFALVAMKVCKDNGAKENECVIIV